MRAETPPQDSSRGELLRQPERLARAVTHSLDVFPDDAVLEKAIRNGRESDAPRPLWLKAGGIEFIWLDLFSVNDVDSSRLWLESLWDSLPAPAWCVALLATRQDRPLRTIAFMDWLKHESRFRILAPAGWHAWVAWCRAPARSLLLFNPACAPEVLLNKLERIRQREGGQSCPLLVAGFGNSHGYGELWRAMISRSRGTSHAG